PDCWSTCFPDCAGSNQSPIDLDDGSATLFGVFDPPMITGPDKLDMIAENIGHSVKFTTKDSDRMTFSGVGLNSTFVLEQFHFHWGSHDNKGSEHTLNGEAFPMEMHAVTYNSKYASFDAAATQSDGLAVFAFFFEVIVLITIDRKMKIIVKFTDDSQTVRVFPVEGLLSNFGGTFFRYSGSLTTPGCTEGITWTTFVEPTIAISPKQMLVFRHVKTVNENVRGKKRHMYNNFRETEPLNDRVLYKGTITI
ncbi:hypothetical protein CAPTEDRAFT_108489, partial [Capitella teleta]